MRKEEAWVWALWTMTVLAIVANIFIFERVRREREQLKAQNIEQRKWLRQCDDIAHKYQLLKEKYEGGSDV